MTYLEALRRKELLTTIDEAIEAAKDKCPQDCGLPSADPFECPYMYQGPGGMSNTACTKCWLSKIDYPPVNEVVDVIQNCTVQILRNPSTGVLSWGWFPGTFRQDDESDGDDPE